MSRLVDTTLGTTAPHLPGMVTRLSAQTAGARMTENGSSGTY